MNRYNQRLSGFPLGTFLATCLAVHWADLLDLSLLVRSFATSALFSCSWPYLLTLSQHYNPSGNPGPEESILLTSIIAGFAGSLSTFAAFIVGTFWLICSSCCSVVYMTIYLTFCLILQEILSLMDPIIFKADGVIYALVTIVWAVIIGYLGSQAKNWADEIWNDAVAFRDCKKINCWYQPNSLSAAVIAWRKFQPQHDCR